MAVAVYLSLDPDAATKVAAVWEALARQSIGLDMRRYEIGAHVTLAVYDSIATDLLADRLAQLARRQPALTVSFPAVGLFPMTRVAFLAPRVTSELLNACQTYHRAMRDLATPWPYYRADQWVPHCTLAEDIGPSILGSAMAGIAALADPWLPLEARLDHLAFCQFEPGRPRPVATLFAAPLET